MQRIYEAVRGSAYEIIETQGRHVLRHRHGGGAHRGVHW